MPRVPTLDNFQTSITNPGAPAFQASNSPTPADVANKPGEALMRAGSAVEKAAVDALQEANTLRVDDATTKLNRAMFSLAYDKDTGYTTQTGERVLPTGRQSGKPLSVEYADALQKQIAEIGASLSNDQQKQLFAHHASRVSANFEANVMSHEAAQYKAWSQSVQVGKGQIAADMIANDPMNRNTVQAATADIITSTRALAKSKGLSAQETEMAVLDATGIAHKTAIENLLRREDTAGAQTYFRTYREQMPANTREALAEKLGVATVANGAVSDARTIWAEMGPKKLNEAVNVDAMLERINKMYPDDKAKREAARSELQIRISAHNATERDANATNTNVVWGALSKGASLARVMQMPEWGNLPGQVQAQIKAAKVSEAYTNEARAASEESRHQAEMQRKGYAAYLVYSDPNNLASMTENEILALAPVVGNQLAGDLISKKRTVSSKPEKLFEAKMDQDEFNSVASAMGLHPFGAGKSEDEKALLGEVKVRVERLIDEAQSREKRPLSREEKSALMRTEMAKKVSVEGTWFGSDEKSVIQLTPKEVGRVIVPKEEREKIVEALRTMYKRNPLPQYEPTKENVRRLYLRSKSPVADMINGQ